MRHGSQAIVGEPDCDRAVLIGTEQGHAKRPRQLNRTGCRVTVVVLGPGTHNGDASLRGRKESRILSRRTVVRNLEDIGVKIHTGAQNRPLAGGFDVTGEQQPQAAMITRLLSFCLDDSS